MIALLKSFSYSSIAYGIRTVSLEEQTALTGPQFPNKYDHWCLSGFLLFLTCTMHVMSCMIVNNSRISGLIAVGAYQQRFIFNFSDMFCLYLSALWQVTLLNTSQNLLFCKDKKKTYGDFSFALVVLWLWNAQPSSLHCIDSFYVFKRQFYSNRLLILNTFT